MRSLIFAVSLLFGSGVSAAPGVFHEPDSDGHGLFTRLAD